MNTLYIHDGCISLIGFDQLSDKAYLTFRNNGLAIASKRMDIENQQVECQIDDRKINDQKLADLLSSHGFLNSHSFSMASDGIYYCSFPN